MSYTSYNVSSCAETIASFQDNITKSKNIIESIDRLINSCYDLVFNIEEKNYFSNFYYNLSKNENSAATFFSNLNKIKRRATQYYNELDEFKEEKNNSENENSEFLNILTDDNKKQLDEEYSDIIEDLRTYTNTFLDSIRNYPNYTYLPNSATRSFREDYTQIITSIIHNILNKNNEYKLKTLLIESNIIKENEGYFCPAKILSEENAYEIYAFFNEKPPVSVYNKGNTKTILDCCNKYITGKISDCKISSGAFDSVFCSAFNIEFDEIQSKYYSRTDKIKKEYSMLIHSLRYLRAGGILVYSCYNFRYTKDICSLLAKYLNNVKIIKVNNIVTVIGIRRKDKVPDQELYTRLRQLWKTDFESDNYEFTYEISPANIEVKIFRGSNVSQEIARDFLSKHNMYNDITFTQNTYDSGKHPLLPFSLGQLGLVLTSGCLDGVIEEKDSHGNVVGCHAIKGTVQKITDRIQHNDIDLNNPTRRITEETISNKVSINVFKPNGELITLA